MFWVKTALLFLLRSGRSTYALALMVVTAVASLIFLSAMAVGVNDAMVRNSTGLYFGQITGFNLPQSISPETLRVEGTTRILKRTVVPGLLSHGDLLQSVVMIGVDPPAETAATALWRKTISGRYPRSGEAALFLGCRTANALGVRPGVTLRFKAEGPGAPVYLTVSGVYRTEIYSLDLGMAFCPRSVLPLTPDTWQAAVFLEEGPDPDAVIEAYRRSLPGDPDFKSWKELMPDLVQLIDLNYVSMGIVMVLVFGVVCLGIACGFVIFILKSLREYGIMKAMGVTQWEIAFLIAAEVLLMNLAACSLGVLVGLVAVGIVGNTGIDLAAFTSHNRYFTVSGVVFPRLTAYSLMLPPAVALVFALVSAAWPVALVVRKRAANILRMS